MCFLLILMFSFFCWTWFLGTLGLLNHQPAYFSIQGGGDKENSLISKSVWIVLAFQRARAYMAFTNSVELTRAGSMLELQKSVGQRYILISLQMTLSLKALPRLVPFLSVTSSFLKKLFMMISNRMKLLCAAHTLRSH